MKILVVNQKLGYSSTSSYSLEVCRALMARGFELKMCTGGGELLDTFRAAGVDVLTVRYNFFSFRKLLQFLREFQPDLMHVQNLRSLGMGQKLATRLGLRHVVTVHHVPTQQFASLRHPLLSGVIAVNEVIRESLVNMQGMPKGLIRVIRSGIDLDRFVPGPPPLSSPDTIPVVGAVGRLSEVKGYHYLIDAARQVLDRGREVYFVMVGNGEQEGRLRRQVNQLDLSKHVTFCPPMPDVAELMRNFDIVVVPTLRGGVGLTALEAMAMRRPVVASAVGELIQVITHGETGRLVKERDPHAIAEQIVDLLDHPDEARALGDRARAWVESQCSSSDMVDRIADFYEDVLEEAALQRETPG